MVPGLDFKQRISSQEHGKTSGGSKITVVGLPVTHPTKS